MKELENFLKGKAKPCLELMFSKFLENKESGDMKDTFLGMLDSFILKSETPGIKRLSGEYDVVFTEEDTHHKEKIRRLENKKIIEITIGTNYYKGENIC